MSYSDENHNHLFGEMFHGFAKIFIVSFVSMLFALFVLRETELYSLVLSQVVLGLFVIVLIGKAMLEGVKENNLSENVENATFCIFSLPINLLAYGFVHIILGVVK